ncbi:MAG TPA: hypothetical protein VN906_04920 [Candidatus Sulfotelmatobacter sp.]|nr:hypothetical protein [Candidatus Sulfotelmatobacter sp.]
MAVEAPRRAQRRATIAYVERRIQDARNWNPPPPLVVATRYVSMLLLLVAIGILVWGLISALAFTSTQTGIPCPDPPQRVSTPPQLVVVLMCVVAFVLGHMTARLQPIDPKMLYVPEGQARAKAKKVGADAGTEDATAVAVFDKDPDKERKDLYHRRNEALIVQALLLLFLLEVAGLLTIEAVTLQRGVWPITYYVRCAYDAAGNQSMLAAAAILFLVGRWFWLPARRQNAASRSE